MVTCLAAALATYLVSAATHVVVFHFFTILQRARAMIRIGISCLPVLFLFYRFFQSYHLDALVSVHTQVMVTTCVIFAFGWYFFNQVYFVTSMSITMEGLAHFVKRGVESATVLDIEKNFSFEKILRSRVQTLEERGYATITSNGGEQQYVVTPKGRLIGAVFSHLKNFFNLGGGG